MRPIESMLHMVLGIMDMPDAGVRLLGGYNQNVYEVAAGSPMVVKLLPNDSSSIDLVLSEAELTEYFADNGIPVARPLTVSGRLFHELSEDLIFTVSEKLPGEHLNPSHAVMWSKSIFTAWGRVMGRMHVLSAEYKPQKPRPVWSDHDMYIKSEERLKHEDHELLELWQNKLDLLAALPVTAESFGVIHNDLHHKNLLIYQDDLSVIDFGDSEYNWFAYDCAIAIYHAVQANRYHSFEEKRKAGETFIHYFMEGYSQHRSPASVTPYLDFFIDFRHVYSSVYHSMHADRQLLTEHQLEYLDKLRSEVLRDEPFLGF